MTAILTLLIGLVAIALIKLILLPLELLSWIHLPLWLAVMGLFLVFSWLMGDD